MNSILIDKFELETLLALKNTLEKNEEEIFIFINTSGGDISLALSMIDILKAYKGKITTINMGTAFSSGSLIFLTGHSRIMYPSSSLLFHDLQCQMGGMMSYELACDTFKYWKGVRRVFLAFLKEKKVPLSFIKYKDRFVFAEEALKLNIATDIGVL
jgi:ATP-dependent protease ClpP protease subunit